MIRAILGLLIQFAISFALFTMPALAGVVYLILTRSHLPF